MTAWRWPDGTFKSRSLMTCSPPTRVMNIVGIKPLIAAIAA
jgi:hypothetical protein